MSGKTHISEDGVARKCVAQPGACHLVHGSTPAEARKNYADKLATEHGTSFTATPLKKKAAIAAQKRATPQILTPAEEAEVRSAVDRTGDWDEYYTATDQKHFQNKDAPGSKFTDPSLSRVEDVVSLAMKQRGNLEGDDRDKLIALGASPTAFRDGNRYLMVNTPGTLGIKSSKDMKDTDLVEVTRTKPGTPVNLVRKVEKQDSTDYGVVVVTKDFESGKPRVITTFPGTVTFSPKNDRMEALEGKTITVAQARAILGGEFDANTRVVDVKEMNTPKAIARPNAKYGFDTSSLSPQQEKLVESRTEKMLAKVEKEYAAKEAELSPDDKDAVRSLKREKSDAVQQVYQKLSQL